VLIDSVSKAERLLQEQPVWPRLSVLQKFTLPLHRLTTHKIFFKKWFPRVFAMKNHRLYYSDGNNGHPDSWEGTLSFASSNPEPDCRYCVELEGARFHNTFFSRTLFFLSFAGCIVVPCKEVVKGQAFAFEIKFPIGVKVHIHARARTPFIYLYESFTDSTGYDPRCCR
jgi:hypothetical protein